MKLRGLLVVVLLALVALAFEPVRRNGFVNLDDPDYVLANPQVREGLSAQGAAWAWTTRHASNWHPLTWLSHMTDVELHGLDARGHHLTSVALHGLTVVLLFLALRALTDAELPSALAAALFAVHPLRVESVAWVAERKDVLSGALAAATLLLWAAWVRRPVAARYLAALAVYALGLMAKPMLVTLPCVQLLLDFWPLDRLAEAPGARPTAQSVARRVVEKLPFFAVAAASSVLTWWAQRGATVIAVRDIPVADRVANALVSIAVYLRQTIWPARLAVYYPHPTSIGERIAGVEIAAAAGLGIAVTAAAWWQRHRRPWLLVGWLWFIGMLVPVLGLMQVGGQARADRYTYLPSIGLAIVVAWGVAELGRRLGRPRWVAAVAVAGLLVLAGATRLQAALWRDSETLYRHALAVTRNNWMVWNNLGYDRLARGNLAGALECFERSAAARPDFAMAWYNQGTVLTIMGRKAEAERAYRRALSLRPDMVEAWTNLGMTLLEFGRSEEAEAAFHRALALRPDHPQALFDLALLHDRWGEREQALAYHRRLTAVAPAKAAELAPWLGLAP
jgi:Flp pilus assembly protein TadD